MHDGDDLIERAAHELKRPVRLGAGLDARILAAVRRQGAHPRSWPTRVWSWLAEPRTVAISPLGGLALAAGAAAMVLFALTSPRPAPGSAAPRSASRSAAEPAAEPASSEIRDDPSRADPARVEQQVQFLLTAPRARSVALLGDFNDWDPRATPLRPSPTGGVWSVTIPLHPGRYKYTFVIDGKRFVPDPAAPPATDDDFGARNSVITIAGSAS